MNYSRFGHRPDISHSIGLNVPSEVSRRPRHRDRAGDRNTVKAWPPESWHEPQRAEDSPSLITDSYKIIESKAGQGYSHIVGKRDVRERIAELTPGIKDLVLEKLEFVELSRVTKKKESFLCYGMQWGATVYLYPLETPASDGKIYEHFPDKPPPFELLTETRRFGAKLLDHDRTGTRYLVWTRENARDYYLNSVLIHEFGHLIDDRNRNSHDRERFANAFALQHGGPPTHYPQRPSKRHHHKG